jgi:UDP-N-acetylmuramoylalanine-D-glutamate ligase
VNDSKATNVDATYTGVKGVRGRKAVVLLGGLAKAGPGDGSLGFTRLVEVLQPHRAVVLVSEALPFSLELFVHFPNVKMFVAYWNKHMKVGDLLEFQTVDVLHKGDFLLTGVLLRN